MMIISSTTNAFMISPISPGSRREHFQRSTSNILTSKNEDDDVFYDDFADFDFQAPTKVDDALSQLLVESKKKHGEQEARISKNWKSGNWNVRGFALDKLNPTNSVDKAEQSSGFVTDDMTQIEFQEKMGSSPKLRRDSSSQQSQAKDAPPTEVCQIVLDEDALYDDASDIMAVGRTDGSVFLIQMGSEYLTKFRTVPRIMTKQENEDGDLTAHITSELVNEDVLIEKMKESVGMDSDSSNEEVGGEATAPFEILHQFRVGNGTGDAVSSLLFHGNSLFTSAGVNGDIQVWDISLDLSNEEMKKTDCKPLRTLTNAHSDKIVILKTLSSNASQDRDEDDASHHNLIFSASLDGSIALWDLKSGDLVYRCQMTDDSGNNISVTCADVDRVGSEHFLYLGLSSGEFIVIFVFATSHFILTHLLCV